MLKIGLIGYGRWGSNYLRTFRNLRDAKIEVICDLKPEASSRIPFDGVAFTTDYDMVLGDKEIEALVIATPAATHYDLARRALERNKHLLIEKPAVLKGVEAVDLADLADRHDRRVMVGHIHQYNPVVRKIQDEAKAGKLGVIKFANIMMGANGPVRTDTSVLEDWGPHAFTILNYVLGNEPLKISANGAAYVCRGLEDMVDLHAVYPGDVRASVFLSWMIPLKTRSFMFLGTEKYLLADDVAFEDQIRIYDTGPNQFGLDGLPDFANYVMTLRTGDMRSPSVKKEEPLSNQVREFLSAIQAGREPETSIRKSVSIVKTIEAARMSLSQSGKLVDI